MDLIGLLPDFGNLGLTIAVFVLVLSVIIAVHEYGHYIAGRWCGIHAEVFSLGFGPELWSGTDKRGTKWRIAAFPLGGYVKFLGDADAASARADDGFLEGRTGAERERERRRSMLGAPLWARSATVAAGPAFNFLLSAAIFTAIFMYGGRAVEPPTIGTLAPLPGAETGLRAGDAILAIEGRETPDYAALYAALDEMEPAAEITYRVRRDGEETEVSGPWPLPPIIGAITPRSAAADAGLEAGDVILAIDGAPLIAFGDIQAKVRAGAGAPMALTVWRAGETLEVTLVPRETDLPLAEGGFERRYLIGIGGDLAFVPSTGAQSFGGALEAALAQIWGLMTTTVSAIAHIASGDISTCAINGPIGIAEAAKDMADQGFQSFIWFVAVISTAVGFMNLFPIPVLDGGHLVFHAWEAVARRPPSDRAVRVLMGAGLAVILALMVFALTNDLTCT